MKGIRVHGLPFMDNSLVRALTLLSVMDSKLISIIFLSLKVSFSALVIASIIGLPFAAVLSLKRFPLRNIAISTINALMGLPPVVVGLVLYILLSRRGLLGFFELLYTPSAMIIAQTLIALPIITGLGHSAITGVDKNVRLAAISLGADKTQLFFTVIAEARYGIMSAVVAAFGRLTAEVGAILIVGGNIAGLTRVMTSAIAMETDKGNFDLAVALGLVLMAITLVINFFMHHIQKKGARS